MFSFVFIKKVKIKLIINKFIEVMKKIICFLSIAAIFSACSEDTLDPFLPGVAFEEEATRTAG